MNISESVDGRVAAVNEVVRASFDIARILWKSCDLLVSKRMAGSESVLFRLGPNACLGAIPLNMDHTGVTADRTVLDIILRVSRSRVQRNHDFLATIVANVAAVIIEGFRLRIVCGITHLFAQRWNGLAIKSADRTKPQRLFSV